jgi:two-component system nitrogen regulation sensor histidine kinase NtrY
MYLKAFLSFLLIVTIVGINVFIVDRLKETPLRDLTSVLLWVNFNLTLLFLIIFFSFRKLYKVFVVEKISGIRKKVFVSFLLVLGVPFLFLSAVTVVGQTSYLRVFTDEKLKEVSHCTEELLKYLEDKYPNEVKNLKPKLEKIEDTTEELRKLVRSQKVQLINFYSFFALLSALIFLGVISIAYYLAKNITEPVEFLSREMEKVGRDNLQISRNYPQNVFSDVKEYKILFEKFKKMVTQLNALYKNLEKDRNILNLVFNKVSTGVALFHKKTGQLVKANENYKKFFNFNNISNLERFISQHENFRYEKEDLGSHYLVFIEDLTPYVITRRYEAWKEIAQRLAHDIKNPLNAIQLSLDAMERFYEVKPELWKEKFPKLKKQIEEQINYITDLVDAFNNLTSEKEKLKREKFPLRQLLFEVKKEFETDQFKVFVEISPIYVNADKKALKRVFENLVRNAYEVCTKEGRSCIVRIFNKGLTELHIVDNGPGIPKEKADKIFLPFVSTKGKGRGLGLFIVKKLLQEHGWDIVLLPKKESEGAHFVVKFSPEDVSSK